MEKLNKDELFNLAVNLDLPALLNLCSSSKYVKKKSMFKR